MASLVRVDMAELIPSPLPLPSNLQLSPEEAIAADEITAAAAAGPAVRSSLAKAAPTTATAAATASHGSDHNATASFSDIPMTKIEALPAPNVKSILAYIGSVLKKNVAEGSTLTDQLLEFTVRGGKGDTSGRERQGWGAGALRPHLVCWEYGSIACTSHG